MPEKKYTPKRGEVVVVERIPDCDFCEVPTPGPIDFAVRGGGWAHGCLNHWVTFRASAGFGVGRAQRWITRDQVADTKGRQEDE